MARTAARAADRQTEPTGGDPGPVNPGYAEDVTMRLHPRRRRVSPDGQLEELG
jgi:hypothetical protein